MRTHLRPRPPRSSPRCPSALAWVWLSSWSAALGRHHPQGRRKWSPDHLRCCWQPTRCQSSRLRHTKNRRRRCRRRHSRLRRRRIGGLPLRRHRTRGHRLHHRCHQQPVRSHRCLPTLSRPLPTPGWAGQNPRRLPDPYQYHLQIRAWIRRHFRLLPRHQRLRCRCRRCCHNWRRRPSRLHHHLRRRPHCRHFPRLNRPRRLAGRPHPHPRRGVLRHHHRCCFRLRHLRLPRLRASSSRQSLPRRRHHHRLLLRLRRHRRTRHRVHRCFLRTRQRLRPPPRRSRLGSPPPSHR